VSALAALAGLSMAVAAASAAPRSAAAQADAAQPARQTALPAYEIAAHCREVAAESGYFSQSLFEHCRGIESNARARLAEIFARAPEPSRAACLRAAAGEPTPSYALLEFCLSELAARAEAARTAN